MIIFFYSSSILSLKQERDLSEKNYESCLNENTVSIKMFWSITIFFWIKAKCKIFKKKQIEINNLIEIKEVAIREKQKTLEEYNKLVIDSQFIQTELNCKNQE